MPRPRVLERVARARRSCQPRIRALTNIHYAAPVRQARALLDVTNCEILSGACKLELLRRVRTNRTAILRICLCCRRESPIGGIKASVDHEGGTNVVCSRS